MTGLVKDVERSLVHLVRMASTVDSITGVVHAEEKTVEEDITKGEGPQIDKEKEDVVASQDDVDELLSSLGF